MCEMISCLVDRNRKVYAFDGIHSHSRIAKMAKINEDECLKYEYDLETRTLRQDFDMDNAPFEAKQSHDSAAMAFFLECAGTAEKLIEFVKRGNVDYSSLLYTLIPKGEFNLRTQESWKNYRECLNLEETNLYEIYNKNVMEVWLELFSNPENRISIWR